MHVHQKLFGVFYTPDQVAKALVQWVVRSETDRLLDPSCGDGRFLTVHGNSVGVERDRKAAALARERAPRAEVYEADFFTWAESTRERFECAAGNPPFIRYQHFSGAVRKTALTLAARCGATFTALTSSWAPFLVAASSVLKPGGRMAFVVPAEIGHAPYAAPLISYLVRKFGRVHVVAVRNKVFSGLSEDTWFLYTEGYRESTRHIHFTRTEAFEPLDARPRAQKAIPVSEWEKWRFRLRPFILPDGVRGLYEQIASAPASCRLGELARVGIGYVTGANDFFHLRPTVARLFGIPEGCLQPTVRNARCLPDESLTRKVVEAWLRQDQPVLLLRLRPGQELPGSVLAYLDSAAGREARESYKCRHREPWYAVPDVRIPDGFLSYMSGEGPSLVANSARCACTNSLHAVHLKNSVDFVDIQRLWRHPLTRLSCELEGHPLGGGMLKLEPGEAARVLLPSPTHPWSEADLDLLQRGIGILRRWRHYE